LLVDADGQAELTRLAGLNSYELSEDLGSVLLGEVPIQAAIRQGVGFSTDSVSLGSLPAPLADSSTSLDLVPASHCLEDFALPELTRCDAKAELLRWTLSSVKHQYDFILIDGAQAMSLLNQNALAAAELAVVPMATGLGVFAEDELQGILATCLELRPDLAPDRLWVLPTRYKRRSMSHQRTLRHLREQVPAYSRLLGPVHHSSWVEAATRNRQPIREVHRGLEATESYRLLAREFAATVSQSLPRGLPDSLEAADDASGSIDRDLWPRP